MSIQDYEVREELARGSMGVVFRAWDRVRGCDVALKRMRYAGSRQDYDRFQNEVLAAQRVHHPNVVGIHASGQDGSGVWMVMDLIEGQTLDRRIHDVGPLPLDEAIELGRQLADALHHAHSLGIVHRDLKPENVLLAADGSPRLADFGLARLTDRDSQLTQDGDLLGTPVYMSPEQAEGDREHVGPLSDVYGLGATLYHAFTGRPPFHGDTIVGVLEQVITKRPRRPSSLRPEIPPALDDLLLRCLSKAPGDRPGSAEEVARALESALRPVERPRAWLPMVAIGLVLAVVLGGGLAALNREAPAPEAPPLAAASPSAPPLAAASPSTPPARNPSPQASTPAPARSPLPAPTPSRRSTPAQPVPSLQALDLPTAAREVVSLLERLEADAALARAQELVAEQPQAGLAQLVLGQALAEHGRWGASCEALRFAFRQDPSARNGIDPESARLIHAYSEKWGDPQQNAPPPGWTPLYGGRWGLDGETIQAREAGLGPFQMAALLADEAPPRASYRLEFEINLDPAETDQPSYAGVMLGARSRTDFFTVYVFRNHREAEQMLREVGGIEGYKARTGAHPIFVRSTRMTRGDWTYAANELAPPQHFPWIRVAIDVEGARLRAWIGGEQVLDLTTARALDGRVGLLKYYDDAIDYRGWRLESR